MSFGRNPHVTKAEIAEQKALSARDGTAREMAWRDAAHQWDRAASREKDDKRRQLYADNADAARENADSPSENASQDVSNGDHAREVQLQRPKATKPSQLN